MTVLVKGLMHVYGPPGAGKTFFALTTGADPKKTVFLDGDASKGKYIAGEIGIPKDGYKDITVLCDGLTEVEHFQKFREIVDRLPGGLDLIIWDNPKAVFNGAHSYVATHRTEFREKWAPQGGFAGGQEWVIARQVLLPRVYSKLQEKATLVIICSHEREQTDKSGVYTGFMEPNADPSLRTESGIVIRLARNTRDPEKSAPIGLVIKNHGTIKNNVPTRIFPERLSPATWERIRDYLTTPIGDRVPNADEKPDEFEIHLIEGTLNPEQKRLYEWRREMAVLQADSSLAEDVVSAAANYLETPAGALPSKIMSELSEAYPELTTDKVREILKKSKE